MERFEEGKGRASTGRGEEKHDFVLLELHEQAGKPEFFPIIHKAGGLWKERYNLESKLPLHQLPTTLFRQSNTRFGMHLATLPTHGVQAQTCVPSSERTWFICHFHHPLQSARVL